jgi:hypothetical protein
MSVDGRMAMKTISSRSSACVLLCALFAVAGCTASSGGRPAQARSAVGTPSTVTPAPSRPALQANDCSVDALALAYYSGGPGAGNDFGSLVLANTSAEPCTLVGPLRVVGIDARGVADTNGVTGDVKGDLVLTARGGFPPVRSGFPSDLTDAGIALGAAYRDDPTSANGLCTEHQVIPVGWRLTFANGSHRTVANRGKYPSYPSFRSLITCRGRVGVMTRISRAFA